MLISECPIRGGGEEEFSFYIQSEGPPTPARASAAAIPQQAARPALSGGLSSAPGPALPLSGQRLNQSQGSFCSDWLTAPAVMPPGF